MESVWTDRDAFAEITDPWDRDIRQERHQAVITDPSSEERLGRHLGQSHRDQPTGSHERQIRKPTSSDASEFYKLCWMLFEQKPRVFLRISILMLAGALAFAGYSVILFHVGGIISVGKVVFAVLLGIASAGFFSLWREIRNRVT